MLFDITLTKNISLKGLTFFLACQHRQFYGVLCASVCAVVRLCTCLWASSGSERSEAPAGLFSTEFSPWRHQSHYTQQPSTDWLHSAAVLEIEFFLLPTGSNHIAFTLFIPLFYHIHVCTLTLTHRHTDSYCLTLMWMFQHVSTHFHTFKGLASILLHVLNI